MSDFRRMTDGAHKIVVAADKVKIMEDKGFYVEGDAELEPGHLVGYIRVRPPPAPVPYGHQERKVEVTDGNQTIWVDRNYLDQWAVYVRKGFLELPPMPPKPDLGEVHDMDEIAALMKKWDDEAAPIRAAREQIGQRALALEDGRGQ